MSKADEMFKELGYKKYYDEIEEKIEGKIIYIKGNPATGDIIEFNLLHHEIIGYVNDKYIKHAIYFTLKELQAINEKVKELGWNEYTINKEL